MPISCNLEHLPDKTNAERNEIREHKVVTSNSPFPAERHKCRHFTECKRLQNRWLLVFPASRLALKFRARDPLPVARYKSAMETRYYSSRSLHPGLAPACILHVQHSTALLCRSCQNELRAELYSASAERSSRAPQAAIVCWCASFRISHQHSRHV